MFFGKTQLIYKFTKAKNLVIDAKNKEKGCKSKKREIFKNAINHLVQI